MSAPIAPITVVIGPPALAQHGNGLPSLPLQYSIGWRLTVRNYITLLSMLVASTWNGSGFRRILRSWKWLSMIEDDQEFSFYGITCDYCDGLVFEQKLGITFESRSIEVMDCNPACILCDIIRRVSSHFFPENTAVTVEVDHLTKIKDLRLWFKPSASINDRDMRIHLYSREPSNPKNPFSVATKYNNVCSDPASDRLVRTAKSQIEHCVNSHKRCATSVVEGQAMPKRLVKVAAELRLVSTEGPVRYIALSYCWGGYDCHKTLGSNVADRHKSLDLSMLPKTLKDAILFTQRLGVDHIWIDSLCIVQDDREEWEVESAKMADIYSGAYVVLAATRASGATEGFLQPRQEPFSITSQIRTNRTFTVEARIGLHEKQNHISNQPLDQRGWCLQECLLANRILHFLPEEVLYICNEYCCCECGTMKSEGPNFRSWPLLPLTLHDGRRYAIVSQWLRLVEGYSRRRFTNAEDILPAFSGLAQRASRLHLGAYIAGMWETDIAFQLSWNFDHQSTADWTAKEAVLTRPTFSWVTFPGPIKHPPTEGTVPKCALVQSRTIPATCDPFGRLSYASITLRGQKIPGVLLAAIASHSHSQMITGENMEIGIETDRGPRFPINHSYDGLHSIFDWRLIIGFGLTTWVDASLLCVLLLQYCAKDNAYVRVGIAPFVPQAWFESNAEDCIITIV